MIINDEIIVEFMGKKVSHTNVLGTYVLPEELNVEPYRVRYSSSWDCLIPVVQKIDDIINLKQKEFPEDKALDDPTGWRAWSYMRIELTLDRDQLYSDVVDFILWYNQIK